MTGCGGGGWCWGGQTLYKKTVESMEWGSVGIDSGAHGPCGRLLPEAGSLIRAGLGSLIRAGLGSNQPPPPPSFSREGSVWLVRHPWGFSFSLRAHSDASPRVRPASVALILYESIRVTVGACGGGRGPDYGFEPRGGVGTHPPIHPPGSMPPVKKGPGPERFQDPGGESHDKNS